MIYISNQIRCRRAVWPWIVAVLCFTSTLAAEPLPGTSPLDLSRDVDILRARGLKQAADYYQRRIDQAKDARRRNFRPDLSSVQNYEKSLEPYRARCRSMLGLIGTKADIDRVTVDLVAEQTDVRIDRVTIPVLESFFARGLMFSPTGSGRRRAVIVCPDADTWPERFLGLTGEGETPRWLASLVDDGITVFLMQSIERLADHPYSKTINNKDRRKILYRLGYPVGRTMPGLDIQDATAVVDYLTSRPDIDPKQISLAGVGQGGMTALYTAAIDKRISATVVIDYFEDRDRCWQEPVDRRMCGQLLEFGDAELAAMVAPRRLCIARTEGSSIKADQVTFETAQARRFYVGLDVAKQFSVVSVGGQESAFTRCLAGDLTSSETQPTWTKTRISAENAQAARDLHFEERLEYLRRVIGESEATREDRWKLTDRDPADFEHVKAEMLADYGQLIGKVPSGDVPLNPKTELALETDRYKLYRVTLDVTEGVEVYGNLLVPNDIRNPRAAVICQHGMNGRPELTTGLGLTKETAYHEFGRSLAEHGYVVFAPYLLHGTSEENNIQARMADVVGMMRVAMPIAKTNRVIDFLEGLPFVDGKRIGYYGLSYGGYSAIWISPLASRLAAVVISGHFNDWRSKITNDTLRTSYLWHPDEDFYNYNILHRFTHPEQIAMAAPRPTCVEFAQRDGITTPEWTAYAWKQVVQLRDHFGFTDRIELNHFDGVHEIHAIGATDFLDRFLRPTLPVGRDYEDAFYANHPSTRYPHAAEAEEPFVARALDGADDSRIIGRFWIPSGTSTLNGMAIKLSRTGQPGGIEIRFGSQQGSQDLGIGKLESRQVSTDAFASWHEVRIEPASVKDGQLVYFEVRVTGGASPKNSYTLYGPRAIGGKDFPNTFGLSYRLLTAR